MTDPQKGIPRDRWLSHDGVLFIDEMLDEHLLNAYKTCVRHNNPKADDLLSEIKDRNLDWRL